MTRYTYEQMLEGMNSIGMTDSERETVAAVICEVVNDDNLTVPDILKEADALARIQGR